MCTDNASKSPPLATRHAAANGQPPSHEQSPSKCQFVRGGQHRNAFSLQSGLLLTLGLSSSVLGMDPLLSQAIQSLAMQDSQTFRSNISFKHLIHASRPNSSFKHPIQTFRPTMYELIRTASFKLVQTFRSTISFHHHAQPYRSIISFIHLVQSCSSIMFLD